MDSLARRDGSLTNVKMGAVAPLLNACDVTSFLFVVYSRGLEFR